MYWFGILKMMEKECGKIDPVVAAKNIEYSRKEAVELIERIQHFFDLFICNLED